MKTFIVSNERLSNVLLTLWESCEENGARLDIDPAKGEIRVVDKGQTLLAKITALDVVDEYDLAREIF